MSETVPRRPEAFTGRPLDGRAALLLAAAALVLFGAALFYAFVMPLTPVRLATAGSGLIEESALWSALAALPWPVPRDPAALAVVLLAVGGFSVIAYAAAIAVAWGRRATGRGMALVLVPAAAFLTVSALALPSQSSDILDYLLSGRVAAVHGASPYEVSPDAFADDPFLRFASGTYTSQPEPKPPVWMAAAIAAATLTATLRAADAVLLARLLLLALTALNIGLIAAILHRWRPRHVLSGLVMYAWSPIVVLHGQAKFDTLMATFALLSALFLVHGRRRSALVAMWLSVLVKLLTLPLVVMSAIGELAARRWRQVVEGALVVAVITLVLYVAIAGDPLRMVDHMGLTQTGGRSLPAVIALPLAILTGAAVVWAGIRSRGEPEATLQGWALVSLTVVLLSPVGWAWYLISPIALVSLSGERWKSAALVGLSGVALLADTWLRNTSRAFPLPVPFGLDRSDAIILGVAVVGAALVVIAWLTRRRTHDTRARRSRAVELDTD